MVTNEMVWEQVEDQVINGDPADPRSRTAAAYEGREVVMFLRPTLTMAVESWAVDGSYDLWYIRSGGPDGSPLGEGGARSSSTEAEDTSIRAGFRYGNRVLLEMALSELAAAIRVQSSSTSASESQGTRSDTTSGTTGTTVGSSSITVAQTAPPLATRSDQLRNYYIASGAVYDGDDRTTVLPPPSPTTIEEPTTTTT